jgi:hypothetical protein
MNDNQLDAEERWLNEQFSRAMPELPDNGFSRQVLGQIRRRAVLRNAVPVVGVLAGIGILVWPAAELMSVLGSHMPAIGQFDWQHALEANKTLALGLLMGILSPVLVALLED